MKENINNFFSFPELINEISARFVAFGVLLISVPSLILLINENSFAYILLFSLTYGFLARVSSGQN